MNHFIDNPNLEKITNQSHKNNTGFCRHYMFLYSLVLGLEAKKVLEFGSGFSTTCILKALELTKGHLTSLEQRPISQQKDWFTEQTLEENKQRWSYVQVDSINTVQQVSNDSYDLVLHDGSHTASTVKLDINNILPCIKKGILLIHDTTHYQLGAEMMRAINSSDIAQAQHEILTLPYGYGLTLVRILQTKNPEEINLTWKKQN